MLLSPAKSTMQIKGDALWNFKLVIMFISKLVHLRVLKDFKKRVSLLLAVFGPFRILARRGAMAYQLELPQSLSSIHDVFHVSQLKKCLRIPIEMVNIEELDIQPNLSYKEYPIRILDQTERKIRNKTIKFVKVQWSHHSEREATWELEDQLKNSYPNLFVGK